MQLINREDIENIMEVLHPNLIGLLLKTLKTNYRKTLGVEWQSILFNYAAV